MEAYGDFAQVYDIFMDDTPYEKWCQRVTETLCAHGIRDGLVLDLGCGTGNMTELLAARGYDMIGVDLSDRMLEVAVRKQDSRRSAGKKGAQRAGRDILYLQQDMREFELYGTVRAVVCLCDSVNYLLQETDLLRCFGLVNNYLDPGGLFVFDFNTVYKYETIIGNAVIAENRDNCSFIWENYYDATDSVNEYDLTVFVREKGDCFRRFTETHLQRGYTLEQMRSLLDRAGLSFLQALDADTDGPVTDESQRIFVVAREKGKVL